jgi:hypothetical protein
MATRRCALSFRAISASRCEINHRTDANERALGGITWFHSRKAFADNDEDMVGRFISGRWVCARARARARACIEMSGKLVSQV